MVVAMCMCMCGVRAWTWMYIIVCGVYGYYNILCVRESVKLYPYGIVLYFHTGTEMCMELIFVKPS